MLRVQLAQQVVPLAHRENLVQLEDRLAHQVSVRFNKLCLLHMQVSTLRSERACRA